MDKRFERVYAQKGLNKIIEIWVDTETGVQYIYHSQGYGGGMTVLVDEDGKPLIKK